MHDFFAKNPSPRHFFRCVRIGCARCLIPGLVFFALPSMAAEPVHGVAVTGMPALAPGFTHLPYADPDAPRGGRMVYGEVGSFDSLNPYNIKGRAPWGVRTHVIESLMARSWDEPFSLYGRLADTITMPEDRAWVAFELHAAARFSDGTPVTVEDVIFSLETLRDHGRPNHRLYYSQVTGIERLGMRQVRFRFRELNRELPLIMGLMPILQKAQWEGKDFSDTTLQPLVGSGPYVIESFDPGRSITFRRDPDWWGSDLPVNRGLHNFDEIRYEYFRDQNARFEAFKAGEVRLLRETNPMRWETGYDFPAAREGQIRMQEIPHHRPSGMFGLVMNTRRPPFDDLRVRQAMEAVFDFEWINQTLFGGTYRRITSYFANSELAHSGAVEGLEQQLLAEFQNWLPPGTLLQAWQPTAGDGSGRDRRRLRRARKLLTEAGWTVQEGNLRNAAGVPLRFEILLGSSRDERTAAVLARLLKPLGIEVTVNRVDEAQYQARLTEYDFDAIIHRWVLSLSPGAEQKFYWGSAGTTMPGTRNYAGINSPAVDAMVAALEKATRREEFLAAARALDRVLSAGVYVVPFWYESADRFAWWEEFRLPARHALYGYRPETWWSERAR